MLVSTQELKLFENSARKRRSNGATGPSFYRSIFSAVPALNAARDRFVGDLAWPIQPLRNPPEKTVVGVCNFPRALSQEQLAAVLDRSQPDRFVFTFRGIDDVRQFLAWNELRRELTVFAWMDRPVAVIEPVPRNTMSTRARKELAESLGSTTAPFKIEVEQLSLLLFKTKKALANDVVTFVPRASRDFLVETAEESAYVADGALILASLGDGEIEAAKELVRRCRLSEWIRAEMPPVDNECLVCAPGGNYVIWSRPSKSLEEVSRFLRERAAARGWGFEVDRHLELVAS